MSKGMSVHIGVNAPSPPAYGGYDDPLLGCENDAAAMAKIASDNGFRVSPLLLGPAAKADVILGRIAEAATSLNDGDTFFLTFAGHGSVVKSTDSDEEETMDQTWVLFDRQLIDDELYQCWTTFKPGVRVIVVSDSCFSGSVISLLELQLPGIREFASEIEAAPPFRIRALPRKVAANAQAANAQMYADIQKAAAASRNKPVNASVLLLAACEDWQVALDGYPNGVFTAALLGSYDKNDPPGYESLYESIHRVMRGQPQEPKWFPVGIPSFDFWHSSAFSI